MTVQASLIASCGLDCATCYAHLREKNPCPGCRRSRDNLPISRQRCPMRTCEKRTKQGFCACADVCPPLARLDKRYRLRYRVSPLENLCFIREQGLNAFQKREAVRWQCPRCGGTLCMHTGRCASCENGALLGAGRKSSR